MASIEVIPHDRRLRLRLERTRRPFRVRPKSSTDLVPCRALKNVPPSCVVEEPLAVPGASLASFRRLGTILVRAMVHGRFHLPRTGLALGLAKTSASARRWFLACAADVTQKGNFLLVLCEKGCLE